MRICSVAWTNRRRRVRSKRRRMRPRRWRPRGVKPTLCVGLCRVCLFEFFWLSCLYLPCLFFVLASSINPHLFSLRHAKFRNNYPIPFLMLSSYSPHPPSDHSMSDLHTLSTPSLSLSVSHADARLVAARTRTRVGTLSRRAHRAAD